MTHYGGIVDKAHAVQDARVPPPFGTAFRRPDTVGSDAASRLPAVALALGIRLVAEIAREAASTLGGDSARDRRDRACNRARALRRLGWQSGHGEAGCW